MDQLFGDSGNADSELTNGKAKDDPWDRALIDIVPIPPENQQDAMTNADVFDPFSIF